MAKGNDLQREVQDDFLKIAEEFLRMVARELDPFTSKKSTIEVKSDSVIMFTPSHIQFAKYGRGPGKKPLLDPLIDWISKKGIVRASDEIREAAFAIQNSISKKGTNNWVPNAPNALEEAIKKNFNDYADKLANQITIDINDKLLDLYKEAFPETVTIKA